ncbi:MAG: BLUF domain-containing protein [Anaerolineales bacterium]|nr:BLUF domain-containing protein [Anaerolineales bacterium]
MISIIYVSTSVRLLSDDELMDILKVSRENNSVSDVTGLLLYKGGNFMQVLEGPEDVVNALYEKSKQTHVTWVFPPSPLNRYRRGNSTPGKWHFRIWIIPPLRMSPDTANSCTMNSPLIFTVIIPYEPTSCCSRSAIICVDILLLFCYTRSCQTTRLTLKAKAK